jgi:hypothetical protein
MKKIELIKKIFSLEIIGICVLLSIFFMMLIGNTLLFISMGGFIFSILYFFSMIGIFLFIVFKIFEKFKYIFSFKMGFI